MFYPSDLHDIFSIGWSSQGLDIIEEGDQADHIKLIEKMTSDFRRESSNFAVEFKDWKGPFPQPT